MAIGTHRGSDVKATIPAEHWPASTDQWCWSLTVAGRLAGIPVGHAEDVNGRVVARRGPDEYEVVTYGRRVVDRATACLWVAG